MQGLYFLFLIPNKLEVILHWLNVPKQELVLHIAELEKGRPLKYAPQQDLHIMYNEYFQYSL